MSRKYQDAPIVEALCEFQFESNVPWNPTIPGLIYTKLQDDFPKARTSQAIELNAQTSPVGLVQQLRTGERAVFLTEDEKSLIQIGQHVLVINRLQPYQSWEAFQPLIRQGFDAYQEVVKATRFKRIGLRYINQIAFDPGTVPLDEYFDFRPHLGSGFNSDMAGFAQAVQFARENGRDAIRIQIASGDIGGPAVILDIDYWLAQPEHLDLSETFDWIETAHQHIESAFEACITVL